MLNLTHIDLRFRATRAVRLPEYTGSAWRGAFGHALRRAVCITGQPECDECPVRSSCTYTEIFETQPPVGEGFLSRYSDAPHPYLIVPGAETALAAGETAGLRMTLIGRSARHAQTASAALSRAVSQVGSAGELEPLNCELRAETSLPAAPEPPPAARIVLESPLRLRVQDRYWKPADFCFAPFFSTLLRRLTQLRAVHGDGSPDVDARALVDAASRIELREIKLHWQTLHRYSSRQKQKIPMGGLLGSFEIQGDLASLWPWLWAGQFVHVGKGTVMGLGRYRIESLQAAVEGIDASAPREDAHAHVPRRPFMSAPRIKNDRVYTYADYLKFPEDERWEIIDGVAYEMSFAEPPEHQDVGLELATQIRTQLRGKPWRAFIAPVDVRFENQGQADTVVQPDLLVVCDRSKITPKGIVGAPDWIIEVLSPKTAGKDQITKRALYEKHGVREYWLVHPTDHIVFVYRLAPGGSYGAYEVLETLGKLAVVALPGIEIDWGLWESLDAEPDESGESIERL